MPQDILHNEIALLQHVAAGDEAAFRQLVDIYWKKVYGNTLALTKSTQTAEELTQDIFLKIWKQRSRLAEVENFSVYIYVVGRNQVVSAMRKKIKEIAGEPNEERPEEILLPDLQLETKEMRRIINEGIERLPAMRKKVFTMNRSDGLSYEEIAVELGISRNTVKEHIVLSLNFLRNYVRAHTGDTLMFFLFCKSLAENQ